MYRNTLNSRMPQQSNMALLGYITAFAILLTNLSQLPYFVDSGITKYLSYPTWIVAAGLTLIFVVIKGTLRIPRQVFFLLGLLAMAFLFVTFLSAATDNVYFSSDFLLYSAISVAVFLMGTVVADYSSKKTIMLTLLFYVISSIIVEVNVYTSVLSKSNVFEDQIYAYESKNSISLLITTTIILLFLYIKNNKLIIKIIASVIALGSSVILIMLKSRACILGLLLALIVTLLSKVTSKKMRRLLWVIVVVFVIVLFTNRELYDTLVNNVMFINKDSSDLNAISSGRVNLISDFPRLFNGKYITGIGSYYFECAPLSAILQFGVFGGFFFIWMMFYPLYDTFKYRQKSQLNFVLYLITITYVFNAFFEGLAPFGPGAKCFFLWFFWGLMCEYRQKSDENDCLEIDE